MAFRLGNGAWFALGAIALACAASVTVVGEAEQVVVVKGGKPDRVINRFRPEGAAPRSGAGLALRIPLLEQLVRLPRGLLTVTNPGQELRTADGQVLVVDSDITVRVFDPVRAVERLGGADGIDRELGAWLPGILREEFGKVDATRAILPGSGGALQQARTELDRRSREFGIQVIDLRLAGIGLPASSQAETLAAMRERREALTLDVKLKGATAAQAITSQTEAQAAAILQASAGRDPEFYDFYRAMRSYDAILANPDRKDKATIVLQPGEGYLKHFNSR